jgi:hypothetical protein
MLGVLLLVRIQRPDDFGVAQLEGALEPGGGDAGEWIGRDIKVGKKFLCLIMFDRV